MQEVFDITVPWISNIPARPVACLLCGERRIRLLNTFVLNGARFFTVRCLSDGMMWLDPQPTPEFYHRLYAEHYHLAGQDDPLLEQATLDVHTDVGVFPLDKGLAGLSLGVYGARGHSTHHLAAFGTAWAFARSFRPRGSG